MKWKRKERPSGTIRIVEKFLIFPYEINDEFRWFEWVKIKQEWIGADVEVWRDIEFID